VTETQAFAALPVNADLKPTPAVETSLPLQSLATITSIAFIITITLLNT